MANIRKSKQGLRETFDFKSDKGVKGRLSFDDEGFAFNAQVSQENIINLSYSSTVDIDCTKGNIYTLTLTGDASIIMSNSEVGVYTIVIKQDSVGSHSITLPDEWLVISDDGLPDFSSDAANTVNVISILYDGTNYYVTYGQNFVAVSTL